MTDRLPRSYWPVLLAGCGERLKDIVKEPQLTPVGAGMRPNRVAVPGEPGAARAQYAPRQFVLAGHERRPVPRSARDEGRRRRYGQDLDQGQGDAGQQHRAGRASKNKLRHSTQLGLKAGPAEGQAKRQINSKIDSKSETKGEGAINRSESIELLVAAVVTDVMPNGNLVISGTQEVRVNFEVSVLSVQGIVRPRDISTENMVSYERIAEARISYGGRGRITRSAAARLGASSSSTCLRRSEMAPAPTIATGKQEPDTVAAAVPRRPSLLAFLGGMLILTGFAWALAACRHAGGVQVGSRAEGRDGTAGESPRAAMPRRPRSSRLPPIITNLANPDQHLDPAGGVDRRRT